MMMRDNLIAEYWIFINKFLYLKIIHLNFGLDHFHLKSFKLEFKTLKFLTAANHMFFFFVCGHFSIISSYNVNDIYVWYIHFYSLTLGREWWRSAVTHCMRKKICSNIEQSTIVNGYDLCSFNSSLIAIDWSASIYLLFKYFRIPPMISSKTHFGSRSTAFALAYNKCWEIDDYLSLKERQKKGRTNTASIHTNFNLATMSHLENNKKFNSIHFSMLQNDFKCRIV